MITINFFLIHWPQIASDVKTRYAGAQLSCGYNLTQIQGFIKFPPHFLPFIRKRFGTQITIGGKEEELTEADEGDL